MGMMDQDRLNSIPICIICEGAEEYDYLNRLRTLGVWDCSYRIDLVDADGNGNLPARYQDKYQNDSYELVLVFCDTDRKPFEQYKDIKKKINEFHGNDNASEAVIIFGNPCTMQIILQHWDNIVLKTSAKKKNAELIEKYTGIQGYDAKVSQRETMMKLIDLENYTKMLERVSLLSKNDEDVGSSNFDIFMKRLSTSDVSWIDDINKIL